MRPFFPTTTTPSLLTMESPLQRIGAMFAIKRQLICFGAICVVVLLGSTSIPFSQKWKQLRFRLQIRTPHFPKRSYLSSSRVSSVYDYFRSVGQKIHLLVFGLSYDTYRTQKAEDTYWKEAARGARELHQSDARFVGITRPRHLRAPELPPLVIYYTPAVLPEYRDEHTKMQRKEERCRNRPSVKDYCKWHRMVFPGTDHPNEAEAALLIRQHPAEELQKILQISKPRPDSNRPIPTSQSPNHRLFSPKYQTIWLDWFRNSRRPLDRPHPSTSDSFHDRKQEKGAAVKGFTSRSPSKQEQRDMKHPISQRKISGANGL